MKQNLIISPWGDLSSTQPSLEERSIKHLADIKTKAGRVRNGDTEGENLEATSKVGIFLLFNDILCPIKQGHSTTMP